MKKNNRDLYDDETVERRRVYLQRGEDGNEDEYLRVQSRRKKAEKRKVNPKAVVIMVLILAAMAVFYVFWQGSKSTIDDLFLRIYQAPSSIRNFVVEYPEAREFVTDYHRYKDNTLSTNVSGEVRKGTIPTFIQWDPRWAYRLYGTDYFGITGCGPTSLSMVVCGLTGQTRYDPYTVGEWAMQHDYYLNGVGTKWDMMETGAEELGLKVTPLGDEIDRMVSALEEGQCVIASVGPGDFTVEGHFIVLTGIDNDGRIHLNDPNSRSNSGKAWKVSKLRTQIVSMWAYEDAAGESLEASTEGQTETESSGETETAASNDTEAAAEE